MEVILQLVIILGACFAGEVLSKLLPFAFPGSVIAMLLLLALLLLDWLKEKHISTVGDFLLKNMSMFFIPSALGIVEHFALISEAIVPFLLICAITMVLTFAATAYTVMLVRKLQKRGDKDAG